MNIIPKKLIDDHVKMIGELSKIVENSSKEERNLFIKIMNLSEQACYNLFKINGNVGEFTWLFINIHHAIVDDGCMSIIREESNIKKELLDIAGDDFDIYDYNLNFVYDAGAVISVSELDTIIDMKVSEQEFLFSNKEQINNDESFGFYDNESSVAHKALQMRESFEGHKKKLYEEYFKS